MQRDKDGNIIQLKCCRPKCGHIWIPNLQLEKVRQCPKCKSVRWDELKVKTIFNIKLK